MRAPRMCFGAQMRRHGIVPRQCDHSTHGTGTAQKHNQKNHHAKNHVNVTRVVGTKWTALDRTFGWRHFECKEVHVVKPTTSVTGKGHANENERAQTATTKTAERTKSSDQNRPQPKPKPKPKSTKKRTYCLLEATCDPTARLWVEIEILKSRRVWTAGWLQKEPLQQLLPELEREGTGGAACELSTQNLTSVAHLHSTLGRDTRAASGGRRPSAAGTNIWGRARLAAPQPSTPAGPPE